MPEEKLDPNFANLSLVDRTAIEGKAGIGQHQAPPEGASDVTGEAFHHLEADAARTTWKPNWEPIEIYQEGEVVMLDDGSRQLLGRRDMGMWIELADGDERAQPDFLPILWSYAPEQVKYGVL